MVSILIVSRCKYKDYFRFYKVYFHIFIVGMQEWLIHSQHERQSLYNVRTRTYAHASRQLFDHRPPITHNNLLHTVLQRWSKDIQMDDRPPIDHPSISIPDNTFSPSTPFFSYLITVGVLPSIIGHIVHCICATLHNFLPNVGKHFCQRWIILENNIVVYTTARFPGICVNCKCYCIHFFICANSYILFMDLTKLHCFCKCLSHFLKILL